MGETMIDPLSLWSQIRECFQEDDGSLPGIEIDQLSPDGVASIYAMLRDRSQLAGEYAEFWICEQQASVPVDSVPNAAALVAAGKAETFHHCICGLMSGGVELPTLGVFVFPTSIELDYRMGPEWNSAKVAGFFELLRDCCALEPTAVVVPASSEGPPDPRQFSEVWNRYVEAARNEK
jgi:hypothetical protein